MIEVVTRPSAVQINLRLPAGLNDQLNEYIVRANIERVMKDLPKVSRNEVITRWVSRQLRRSRP